MTVPNRSANAEESTGAGFLDSIRHVMKRFGLSPDGYPQGACP